VDENQMHVLMQRTDHRVSQSYLLKTALFVLIIDVFTPLPTCLYAWEKIDFKNTPTQDMFPESDAVVIKNEGQMKIKRILCLRRRNNIRAVT
jgi:hypothetical protein